MKKLAKLCSLLIIMTAASAFGQASMRKMSTVINHPSINVFAPSMSADGNAIVFISDYAEDNVLTPYYSFRDNSDWKTPLEFPKNIYSRLNSLYGFAWSADGKKLFYTTLKTPSVGGFDIWTTEVKGNSWTEPTNSGLPVNTASNEGYPSLSADGNALYFCRCLKMDQKTASACKIFVSLKTPGGKWGTPTELPASINTGNSQSPRLMADGETLIFSSDQNKPSKGGMDLYISRLVNGTWSNPVPLDFVNTENDDQHIAVTALGRYITRDLMGAKRNEIVELLIPDAVRPKGMMKVEGKVTDPAGAFVPNYIFITDLSNNSTVYNGRSYPDGTFVSYIKEGSQYELSIEGEKDNMTFFSKRFDLTNGKIPQKERVTALLKPLQSGDILNIEGLDFSASSTVLDRKRSENQLKRINRLVRGNPSLNFDLVVSLDGYLEDSVQRDADLSEVRYDSLRQRVVVATDSLGQVVKKDTVLIKTIFHNDRTARYAQSLMEALAAIGTDVKRIKPNTEKMPATEATQRRFKVRLVAR